MDQLQTSQTEDAARMRRLRALRADVRALTARVGYVPEIFAWDYAEDYDLTIETVRRVIDEESGWL